MTTKSGSKPARSRKPARTPLAFTISLPLPYEAAIDLVTAHLKDEGFGIITRIDAHRTFEEKLGQSFRPYTILGACNPRLAHAVLSHEPEVGLMLPCNVVVEEGAPGSCTVRIADPRAMLSIGSLAYDTVLTAYAREARTALGRVAAALAEPAMPKG